MECPPRLSSSLSELDVSELGATCSVLGLTSGLWVPLGASISVVARLGLRNCEKRCLMARTLALPGSEGLGGGRRPSPAGGVANGFAGGVEEPSSDEESNSSSVSSSLICN